LDGDMYTLRATRYAKGLSSLAEVGEYIRTSNGVIGEQGIRPRIFGEEKNASSGKSELQAHFDWSTQKIQFSDGSVAALPADAQDELSYMYQFSQVSMNKEIISFPVSNAAGLEKYEFEIGGAEDIDTPIGKLHALHLRKMHNSNEAFFELWLGLEYRLLPVKFRQVNRAGEAVEEMVISDIRASDE